MTRHALLFAVILLGGLLTLTDADFGRVSDGQAMLDTAVNLRQFGDLKVGYSVNRAGFTAEPGGGGRYGIGYPLVEQVPLLLAGPVERVFGMGSGNVLFPLTNLLLHALTALVVALSVEALGGPYRSGALAGLAYAFGTFAWPYVSYEFSEPLQALCVAAAFLFAARAARGASGDGLPLRADLTLSGLALGLALLTKSVLAILAPVFAVHLWAALAPRPAFRRLAALAWFGGALAIGAGTLAATNLHRFGSVLDLGYGQEAGRFSSPLAAGLYGLLLGPNRGLIFYAPVAALLPWGLWAARRFRPREAALLGAAFGLFLVTMARWWGWEGGACWGPRLLMPVLPLGVIGAALILDRPGWPVRVFSACFAAGAAVNLLGVLLHFMVWPAGLTGGSLPLDLEGRMEGEYEVREGRKHFPLHVAVAHVPSLSPIRGHAWLLGIRYLDTPLPLWSARGVGVAAPVVDFGPARYDFGRVRDAGILDRLETADLWLARVVSPRRRERAVAPVAGWSFERLGNAAAANGDAAKALVCYQRALDLIPVRGPLAISLARTQAGLGARNEAIDTLARFLARRPAEAPARLELARLHEEAGSLDAARAGYRAVLDLPSADDETRRSARDAIRRLEEGTGAAQPRGVEPSQR